MRYNKKFKKSFFSFLSSFVLFALSISVVSCGITDKKNEGDKNYIGFTNAIENLNLKDFYNNCTISTHSQGSILPYSKNITYSLNNPIDINKIYLYNFKSLDETSEITPVPLTSLKYNSIFFNGKNIGFVFKNQFFDINHILFSQNFDIKVTKFNDSNFMIFKNVTAFFEIRQQIGKSDFSLYFNDISSFLYRDKSLDPTDLWQFNLNLKGAFNFNYNDKFFGINELPGKSFFDYDSDILQYTDVKWDVGGSSMKKFQTLVCLNSNRWINIRSDESSTTIYVNSDSTVILFQINGECLDKDKKSKKLSVDLYGMFNSVNPNLLNTNDSLFAWFKPWSS